MAKNTSKPGISNRLILGATHFEFDREVEIESLILDNSTNRFLEAHLIWECIPAKDSAPGHARIRVVVSEVSNARDPQAS